MWRGDLTPAEFRIYLRALQRPHERRIRSEVQTLGGNFVRGLDLQVLDGQVDYDVDAEVSRTLSLVFLDPAGALQFEADSPSDAPIHRRYRIRIGYSIRVPELERWVTCPVFTGPIWDFKRTDAEVSIVAHGMERQALGNRWNPRTFAKKSKKTKAIRELLGDVGFQRMIIPDLGETFPGRFTVTQMDQTWPKAKRIAQSLDRHLYCDGLGIPRLRAYPNRPVFEFDAALVSHPSVSRNPEGLINIVEVLGGKPKGQKQRVRAEAPLPPANSMSPQGLAMNGKPLFLGEQVENAHLKTKAACFRAARRRRDDKAKTTAEFGWDSVPIPPLEEMDLVSARTDEGLMFVRMRKWTLPLAGSQAGGTDGPAMSIGTKKNTRKTNRRRR